jgi:hypothetical protein
VFGDGGNDAIDVSGDEDAGFRDQVFCGLRADNSEDVVKFDANDILHGDCKEP